MATKVDELIIQIRADTKQLKRGLADVKNKVNKTFPPGGKSPITRMGGQLKGLIGPLAAVAAGMAAISAIKGIAKTGDEFEALGITLDRIYGSREAGAAAFEDIKAFAETTPFQLETVTEAFIQLKSNGIEPAEEMLTIFGDAASAALNPLEAFNTLIRITQRAAGGGLGLEELEQLVNQGIPVYTILAEKIGKNRTELSELGKTAEGAHIIMTALQAGLKEDFGGIMVERMELLSTKTSNMEIAFKDLKSTLFQSGLGTWLKGLADSMTEFITGINEGLVASAALRELQKTESLDAWRVRHGFKEAEDQGTLEERLAARRALLGLGPIYDPSARPAWQTTGGALGAFQAQVAKRRRDKMLQGVQFMPEGQTPFLQIDSNLLIAQQEALGRLKKVLEDTVTPAEELAEQFADLALITASGQLPEEELLRIRNYLQAIGEEMALEILEDEAKAAADALALVEEAAADALALMESAFGHLQSTIDGTITPIEQLKEEISEIKTALASGDAEVIKFLFGDRSPQEIVEVLDRLGTELTELEADLVEVSETFQEVLAPAIAAAAHQFTTTFVDSLMEGKSALASFKDFAKDIVAQIIATFLQMAVVNQILNAVFGNFTGWVNQPTIGSWGGGGKMSNAQQWDNFYSGGATPRAGGGSVNRGQAYLVGERGPEMFVPNTSGLIRNSANSRGGGSPIIVNQSLNFSTGVVPTVRAEVQRMLPQISEVTKISVLEAAQRGGNYRRGLLGT